MEKQGLEPWAFRKITMEMQSGRATAALHPLVSHERSATVSVYKSIVKSCQPLLFPYIRLCEYTTIVDTPLVSLVDIGTYDRNTIVFPSECRDTVRIFSQQIATCCQLINDLENISRHFRISSCTLVGSLVSILWPMK